MTNIAMSQDYISSSLHRHDTIFFSKMSHAADNTAWASYQIRKIAGCACAGNAGNVFPRRRFQRKLLVSDPGMHHGTCVTHVPWCMSGSLTCGDGKTFPAFPAHAHPRFCVSDKRPMQVGATHCHCDHAVDPQQQEPMTAAAMTSRARFAAKIFLQITKYLVKWNEIWNVDSQGHALKIYESFKSRYPSLVPRSHF